MGNRLSEIEAPQGFAAESSGASVLLASSYEQAREGDVITRGAAVLLPALGGVLCAAALVVGFIALTKR